MRPMSLFESLDSNGKISLGSLFRKEKMNPAVSEKNLLDYAFYACPGGWSKSVGQSEKTAMEILKNCYIFEIFPSPCNDEVLSGKRGGIHGESWIPANGISLRT